MLLFVLFRAGSLAEGFAVIAGMFTGAVSPEGSILLGELLTPAAVLVLVIAIILSGNIIPKLRSRIDYSVLAESAVFCVCRDLFWLCILALSVMSISLGGYNPFIYFQF